MSVDFDWKTIAAAQAYDDGVLDMEEDSRRFVDALDRTPLGRFAVRHDVLVAADYTQRVQAHLDAAGGNASFYDNDNTLMRLCLDTGTDVLDALAEVFFWWGEHEPSLLAMLDMRIDFSDRLRRLSLVSSHPEMHGYFEAGIWDLDFIGECLTNDVDPELASSLNATASAGVIASITAV